jgi:hypothetical protein
LWGLGHTEELYFHLIRRHAYISIIINGDFSWGFNGHVYSNLLENRPMAGGEIGLLCAIATS